MKNLDDIENRKKIIIFVSLLIIIFLIWGIIHIKEKNKQNTSLPLTSNSSYSNNISSIKKISKVNSLKDIDNKMREHDRTYSIEYYDINKIINEVYLKKVPNPQTAYYNNCEDGDQLIIRNGKIIYIPKTDVIDKYGCKKYYEEAVKLYNNQNQEIISIIFYENDQIMAYFSIVTKKGIYTLDREKEPYKLKTLFLAKINKNISNAYLIPGKDAPDCDLYSFITINYKNDDNIYVLSRKNDVFEEIKIKEFYKNHSVVPVTNSCNANIYNTKYKSLGVNIDKYLTINLNQNEFFIDLNNQKVKINSIFNLYYSWVLITEYNELYYYDEFQFINLGTIKNIDYIINEKEKYEVTDYWGASLKSFSIELTDGQKQVFIDEKIN